MRLLGQLFFIIKLGILAASIVILVNFSNTKVLEDSKTKVKDNVIKYSRLTEDTSHTHTAEELTQHQTLPYFLSLLQFYDSLSQCNITAIITIIVFFGGMAITYLTKLKLRIKFILKLCILGLLISFITVASTINYMLNTEDYVPEKDANNKEIGKFQTKEEALIKLENNYRHGVKKENGDFDTNPNKELADKYKNLLQMLTVCRTTSFTSFGLMTFILITNIYR